MDKNKFSKALFISSLFFSNAFVHSTKSEDPSEARSLFKVGEDNQNAFNQVCKDLSLQIERIGIDNQKGFQASQIFMPLIGKKEDWCKYKLFSLSLKDLKDENLPDMIVNLLTEMFSDLNNILSKLSPDDNMTKLFKLVTKTCEGSETELIATRLITLINSLPELEDQDYKFRSYNTRWFEIDHYLKMMTGNQIPLPQMLLDLSQQDDEKLRPLLDLVKSLIESPSFASFSLETISNDRNRSCEYMQKWYAPLYSVRGEIANLIHIPKLELTFIKEGQSTMKFEVSRKDFFTLIKERFFLLTENGLTHHIGSLSQEHKTLLEKICGNELCKFEVIPNEANNVVPYLGTETGSLNYKCIKQRVVYSLEYNRANIILDDVLRGSIGIHFANSGFYVLSCLPDLMVNDLNLDNLIKINSLFDVNTSKSEVKLNSEFEEKLISLIPYLVETVINGNQQQAQAARVKISFMLGVPPQNIEFPWQQV